MEIFNVELFKWYLYNGEGKFNGNDITVILPWEKNGKYEFLSFSFAIYFLEHPTIDNVEQGSSIGTYKIEYDNPERLRFFAPLTPEKVIYKTFLQLEPLLNKSIIKTLFKIDYNGYN
jgi:hypothetical protein